jgi:hypothetical protein
VVKTVFEFSLAIRTLELILSVQRCALCFSSCCSRRLWHRAKGCRNLAGFVQQQRKKRPASQISAQALAVQVPHVGPRKLSSAGVLGAQLRASEAVLRLFWGEAVQKEAHQWARRRSPPSLEPPLIERRL